jgi:hypothetical protein
MIATVVDTKELLETIVYSSIAGIGITLIFSLGIYGSTRLADFSRDGRRLEAGLAGALAVIAVLATIAALIFGIVVMTQK